MNFYENLEYAIKNLNTRCAFLTVKSNKGVNTITISWVYIRFSCNKPYFIAMVGPQRYTYEFLKIDTDCTISIPSNDDMKKVLTIYGTKSDRYIDKEKDNLPDDLKKNYTIGTITFYIIAK